MPRINTSPVPNLQVITQEQEQAKINTFSTPEKEKKKIFGIETF